MISSEIVGIKKGQVGEIKTHTESCHFGKMFEFKLLFSKVVSLRKTYSQRILDDIMKAESPSLDYYIRLVHRNLNPST